MYVIQRMNVSQNFNPRGFFTICEMKRKWTRCCLISICMRNTIDAPLPPQINTGCTLRIIILLLSAVLFTGCALAPQTHEEMKADYAEHHTICSDRNIEELVQHLTKMAAICQVDAPERKYEETLAKRDDKNNGGILVYRDPIWVSTEWAKQPYTLEVGNSMGIFLLLEFKETPSCTTQIDYYYHNFAWVRMHKDYKAWTKGSDECSGFF